MRINFNQVLKSNFFKFFLLICIRKYEPNKYTRSRSSSANTFSAEKIKFSDDKEWSNNEKSGKKLKNIQEEVKKLDFFTEKDEEENSNNDSENEKPSLLNKYFKEKEMKEKPKEKKLQVFFFF